MSRVNQIFRTEPERRAPNKNKDGFAAWDRSDKEYYVQTLLTNTLGQQFYATQNELIKEAEALHRKMVDAHPEFVAKAIVYARNEGYMRTQPIYGLAALYAFRGTPAQVAQRRGLVSRVFEQVVRTPNDLFDFLTILESMGCRANGRRIRRVVQDWLDNKMNEYWVIKYGADKSDSWSLSKVLRHFHPRHKELYAYVRGQEANLGELPKVRAFEALKSATTDAQKIGAIEAGQLPHEVASTFAGSSKRIWDAIVPQMPIMALMRNLATLERHGVLENHRKYIQDMFTDEKRILNSKIFPFRFLDAMGKVQAGWAKDAMRDAVEIAYQNIPEIEGSVAVHLDRSGSMGPGWGKERGFMEIGSIMAIALMKRANLNGSLYLFDTALEMFNVSMRDSILTQASQIHARGGTNAALPTQFMTQKGQFVDTIIMITDEQQNTGTGFYRALTEYRNKVNRNVKTFIIDVASYRAGMVPSTDPNIFYIFGWSDKVLNFISMASKGWGTFVSMIEARD